MEQIRSGLIKGLAVSSPYRLPSIPNCRHSRRPACRASSSPAGSASMGRRGCRRMSAATLGTAMVEVGQAAATQDKFRAIGFEPTGLGVKEFSEFHAAEIKRWVAFHRRDRLAEIAASYRRMRRSGKHGLARTASSYRLRGYWLPGAGPGREASRPAEREIATCPILLPVGGFRSVVTLSNVGKTFANGVVALDRLDLDVRPGEFVSLLGPSGCGKSTALRLIAGLSEPTRGSIDGWSGGRERARRRRRIGFVFQEPTLMPWATVARNVRLPLKIMGSPPARTRGSMRRSRASALPSHARQLSARAVGRHEDARLDRARARHRAEASADGRAVRGARRDHALPAQQRSPGALAVARQDRGVRHPFGVRIGLPLAAHRGDDAAARAASSPSWRSTRLIRATSASAPPPNMPASAGGRRRRWRARCGRGTADERSSRP